MRTISAFLAALAITLLLCGCGTKVKSYSDARAVCETFLSDNKEEMTGISTGLLTDGQGETGSSGKYKDRDYSLLRVDGGKYVKFDIGAQGLLGGQYWSLIYCPDETFCGESVRYSSKEPEGNNIIKAERLDGNWWYYWVDYDGTKYSDE